MANLLSLETSPYLLQHANNPVDWLPWNPTSLQKAVEEDKPIIVSIGYSACHWCHVMERESFEDENIAAIMNQYFVCIKVDREERPDVDQVYLEAVQAMGLQGGWPLNVILTPEAKPFYGGTYFPPQNWAKLLLNIADAFYDHREDIENSAEGFVATLNRSEIEKYRLTETNQYQIDKLHDGIEKILMQADLINGGQNKAPKFPMPCVYSFLLKYYSLTKREEVKDFVSLTLDKMAFGGIYDQIGGGFARYSTDKEWFLPHFEKMLYDNGQLLSLYSEAYQLTQSSLYKETVFQTIDFLQRELLSSNGGFYSALDADSEGVEGKFYVWNSDDLKTLLKDDYEIFASYYNVELDGNWDGSNILFRNKSTESFALGRNIQINELQYVINRCHTILMAERKNRIRPGLDDKILAGWNGLVLKGLVDAYRVFDEPNFLSLAVNNANFIIDNFKDGEKIYRNHKNGKSSISGYLEDYASVIEGLIALYQATFNEKWLNEANLLMVYSLSSFFDHDDGLFFYTDIHSEKLIARKKEIFDNVIPSSNSIMAINLFQLGKILSNDSYTKIATRMLSLMVQPIQTDLYYLANWANLFVYNVSSTCEFAIVGEEAIMLRSQLDKTYFPNKIVVGTTTTSQLPLLNNRTKIHDKTAIYVCYNNTCQLPVSDLNEAWAQVRV